jgi:hypothetical protein
MRVELESKKQGVKPLYMYVSTLCEDGAMRTKGVRADTGDDCWVNWTRGVSGGRTFRLV